MQIGKRQRPHARDCLGKVFVRFAGEARDDVRAEPEPRARGDQALDQGAVHPRIVRPPHRPQYTVAAALQRDVEVGRDHGRRRHGLHELHREVRGEERGEPEPAEPANLDERSQQGGQGRAGDEVGTVVPQIHAGQHHLRVPGRHEETGLVEDHPRLETAAPAPGERHDAECAPVLAAVLDFQERA